jgi:tripartite ATP-independent transporter DctM subunit
LARVGRLSEPAIGALSFVALLVLIALRMPVGLAMLACGAGGYVHLNGWHPFLAYLKTTPFFLFSNYTLSVIPLFIMMGAVAERAGLSQSLFRAASALVGHRRGGMAMAAIGACTAFGAICGSSVATTATMGRAAYPELRRHGYAPALATGTLAVGGTLGILIPPSVILIVYAISTEQNIAKLFMAALVPGLLASFFYMLTVAWCVRRDPAAGPAGPRIVGAERRRGLLEVWPALLIAVVVMGGIYGGVFTPTEGAAVGTIATSAVGLAQRRFGWAELRASLLQTAELSAMIFLILLGAEVFNAFLALSQLPFEAADLIGRLGLPPYAVLAALLAFYIILGGVMDELAMILLTLPVFFPIVMALDFGLDPEEAAIWFGILVLIIVGIGLTAPPIGLNVFVMNAVARDVPITTTYRGVLPFLVTDLVRLVLVAIFPGLALALVRLLA